MKNLPTARALPGKTDRSRYRPVHGTELHKGFYCDNNNYADLKEIDYDGHLAQIDNDEEHLTSADCLLEGSCQAFAMQVEEILGYEAFIIKECNGKGHHLFCQANLEGKIALIDARGVTTNYDEFIHKRPPGTLFDDNPSGRAFVRAPELPGYGARRASQGWRGRE